jgi:hypothetical protein
MRELWRIQTINFEPYRQRAQFSKAVNFEVSGMDEFFAKPVNIPDLESVLNHLPNISHQHHN